MRASASIALDSFLFLFLHASLLALVIRPETTRMVTSLESRLCLVWARAG